MNKFSQDLTHLSRNIDNPLLEEVQSRAIASSCDQHNTGCNRLLSIAVAFRFVDSKNRSVEMTQPFDKEVENDGTQTAAPLVNRRPSQAWEHIFLNKYISSSNCGDRKDSPCLQLDPIKATSKATPISPGRKPLVTTIPES